MRIQLALIACLVEITSTKSCLGQTGRVNENPDSLEQAYVHALAELSPPKLIERKRLVRSVQQRGYASTLCDVLDMNGTTALLSYLKIRLHIELSLPHEPIMVNISALPGAPPYMVGLDIDWTFPNDPWSGK